VWVLRLRAASAPGDCPSGRVRRAGQRSRRRWQRRGLCERSALDDVEGLIR
jgi:hypothetical protein